MSLLGDGEITHVIDLNAWLMSHGFKTVNWHSLPRGFLWRIIGFADKSIRGSMGATLAHVARDAMRVREQTVCSVLTLAVAVVQPQSGAWYGIGPPLA